MARHKRRAQASRFEIMQQGKLFDTGDKTGPVSKMLSVSPGSISQFITPQDISR
jgi:hypothetical protein